MNVKTNGDETITTIIINHYENDLILIRQVSYICHCSNNTTVINLMNKSIK